MPKTKAPKIDPEQNISILGTCEIIAAAAAEGAAEVAPTFAMLAYTGGIMVVGYYGPVVIDIDGMEAADETPIFYNHSGRYSLENVIGQTSKVEKGKDVKATGSLMGDSEVKASVVALVKDGFNFQASIGVQPIKVKYIDEGQTADVNGKTHKGPFMLAVSSKLSEISVVPLGADGKTKTVIKAAQPEKQAMDPKDKAPKTAEEVPAAAVAEQTRITEIQAAAKGFPEIIASAIGDGSTVADVNVAVQAAKLVAANEKIATLEAGKVQDDRPGVPNIIVAGSARDGVNAKAIEAAVCMSHGLTDPEKHFEASALNRAEGIRARTLTELVTACLSLEGKTLNCSRHDTGAFINAAFSTRDLSVVLGNIMNKFIMTGYGAIEETWRAIAEIRNVSNFHAHTGVRMNLAGVLKPLAPNGEIQHADVSDESRTHQADTKAIILGFTRKDIINDDLSVITQTPQQLGTMAARTFNKDFWAAFEAAGAAAFTSGHKNLVAGALTLANLKLAAKAFMEMEDPDGNPLAVMPEVLLTSPTNSASADELFVAVNLVGGTSKDPNTNIYRNKYRPEMSAYLSDAPWYLAANPNAVPLMTASFLHGNQMPHIESSDTEFNALGIQMRCFYDYGVDFAEYRGGVKSTGV